MNSNEDKDDANEDNAKKKYLDLFPLHRESCHVSKISPDLLKADSNNNTTLTCIYICRLYYQFKEGTHYYHHH